VTIKITSSVQIFYVLNAATGSTVTFTTGIGGSSSVTLNANQQAILICDATNVLNATTVIVGSNSISLIDGSVGAPSLNFGSETTTGMYRPGAGQIGWGILGVNGMTLSATGLTVPSGITSGTF
jgi:hypothetical protein